jgi:thiol:disulfide interchange protein DsbC
MMKTRSIINVLFAVFSAGMLLASTYAAADEAAIGGLFQREFPESTVKSVSPAPVPGIFEVVVDGRVLYTSQDGRYVFSGSLIDTKTKRNLTQAALAKINAIPSDRLPLDLAIKRVKGNGDRKIAIFEDPHCPYCRKLEQNMMGIDDLTIYTFLFPIEQIHPGATNESQAIWCDKNPAKAWDDAMLFGVAPKKASSSCQTPIDKIVKFGYEHGIVATPTLFFSDGRRVVGALSAQDLKTELDKIGN